jgi:hypothetical protein
MVLLALAALVVVNTSPASANRPSSNEIAISTTQELREAIRDQAEHIVITDHLDLCDGLGFLCEMLALEGEESRTRSIRVRFRAMICSCFSM